MKRIMLWLAFLLPALAYAQNEDTLAAQIYRHTNAGEFEQALVKANQLISINPKKALCYSLRADVYMATGDGQLALDDLDAAIKLDGKEPLYLMQKASLHNLLLMSDEAIDDANAGLVIATTDVARLGLYNERGLAKSHKGDFQGAVEDFEKVLKMDPTNKPGLVNISAVLDDVGREDEAIVILKKAISLYPDEKMLYGNLGYRYMAKADYAKAMELFGKVLALDPEDAFAYNNRGYAQYKQKKYAEALRDINHSIELNPTNSFAFRNRALISLAQKKTTAACEDLLHAEQLGFSLKYGDEVKKLLEANCR